MQHLVAWGETLDGANAYHFIKAILDTSLFTAGDDIRPTAEIANIIGVGILSAADAALTSARIESPKLRENAYFNVEPLVNAEVWGSYPEFLHFPDRPVALRGNESIRCAIDSNDGSTDNEYCIMLLSDGAIEKATGDFFSVRATGAITLALESWVEGALTFEPELPNGEYQVVGFRARGTNMVAARLIFPGGPTFRPGVPAVNAIADLDLPSFRYGGPGIMGQFNTNQPPRVECLGITDSVQNFILDLNKVG